MFRKSQLVIATMAAVVLAGSLFVWAEEKKDAKTPQTQAAQEQERKVKEAEVAPAALTALKKLAGSAALTEFSEEIEDGHKFYEGSWKSADGNVDALVTETGDLVEIEEIIPAEKAPAAVRAAAEKEAGKDAKITFEKKTMVLYELHFKKGEKGREIILTPDGRPYEEDGGQHGEQDED
jgi:hypothetical protein